MKRYVYLFLLSLLWTACENDEVENVFPVSTEHRVAIAIDSMEQMLKAAPYGWVAALKYNNMQNEQFFHLYFKDKGRVVMVSGMGSETKTSETNYTLKYSQQVDLIFDSYSFLAQLVPLGGDFRFELKSQEGQQTIWNTRGDGNPDLGKLTLIPVPYESYYSELMEMRNRAVTDINRGFYRVLTFDGSDRKYSLVCQANVIFEWKEGDQIESTTRIMVLKKEGFDLDEPFEAEGKRVTHFLYNASEDNFDAYDGDQKVGRLAYSLEKPFARPGLVEKFMKKVGATPATLIIFPIGYSKMVSDSLKVVEKFRDDYIWFSIQPYNNWAIYGFGAGVAYYRIETILDDDEITINWIGSAQEGLTQAALPYVRPSMHMFSGTFSLVYIYNTYYFIRNDDPRISFIAEPQAANIKF